MDNWGDDQRLGMTAASIGDLYTADSALTAVPWGVTADPESGRVYVADWFDSRGTHVDSYGREGDGPGEFRSASAVTMGASGILNVWDAARGVLSRWSSDGTLLEEQPIPLPYWGPGFAVGSGKVVTVTSEESGLRMSQQLVSRSEGGQRVLYELSIEQEIMELPCIAIPAPKVLAPTMTWTGQPDSLYVLTGAEYRIDLIVDGSVKRSIRRGMDPVRVTEEMAIGSVATGPYADFMNMCRVDAAQIVEAVGHESVISPVIGIIQDPRGNLWVTRTSDGVEAGPIDVFSPAGTYEGTLQLAGTPVAFPSDSTMVVLRPEVTGETTVSLYTLRSVGM